MSKLTKREKIAQTAFLQVEQIPSRQEKEILVTLFATGRHEEAEKFARTMTSRFPENGFGWKVLGAVLKSQGRTEESLAPMQKAATLMPQDHEAFNNLGLVLKDLQRLDHAVACHRHALTLKPDFAEAHNNLGLALRNQGHLDEAMVCYRRALALKPDAPQVLENLGAAYRDQGNIEKALTYYREKSRLLPEDEVTQYHIAVLAGENLEHPPAQYVEGVFDSYALTFDAHLQQDLKYKVPVQLVELLKQNRAPSSSTAKWNVLDLGCGTGLVGSAIASEAKQLIGVDLSAKMLEKANARGIYHRLERADLLIASKNESSSTYDVIISADVFIYVGKLDELFKEIKRLLTPGGHFAFSVEAPDNLSNGKHEAMIDAGYQLKNTGRYGHSMTALTALAHQNGFLPIEAQSVQIRLDNDQPIMGHLLLWQA